MKMMSMKAMMVMAGMGLLGYYLVKEHPEMIKRMINLKKEEMDVFQDEIEKGMK